MSEPLTCEDVVFLLTDYMEKAVSWSQRLEVKQHLGQCQECRLLLADLEALPAVFRRWEAQAPDTFQAMGEAALASVMPRLGQPRESHPLVMKPLSSEIQGMLQTLKDLPFLLLTQTRQAMERGQAPHSEPFLPTGVLSQLPPHSQWKWKHVTGGIRRALLWAENNGPSLSLMYVPPRVQIPAHTHFGTESLLVLEGEMEDTGQFLTNGDWIHLADGSSHAPYVFGGGCWCLVRDEGTIRYEGVLGWFRSLMAGA